MDEISDFLGRVIGFIAWVVLLLYLLLIGFIPLMYLLMEPTFMLAVWASVGLGALVLGFRLLCVFSWKGTGVLVALVVIFHAMMLWVPEVSIPLHIDRCLDFGGRWDYEVGACEGSRHPLPGDKDYRAGE